MKKIKILFATSALITALIFSSFQSQAQQKLSPALDSVVNAQTKYLTVPRVQDDFTVMNVDVHIVKPGTGGGTVAGTAILQGNNGSSMGWYTVTDARSIGSVTLADGSQEIRWRVEVREFVNYRVAVTTTGTSKIYINGVTYFP